MTGWIKNFSALATTPLRQAALSIVEEGLAAINTRHIIELKVEFDPKSGVLTIDGQEFSLNSFKRVICVGFGKAAFEAVSSLQSILAERIHCGFVLDLKEGLIEGITCRVGTHPLPTIVNVQATDELVQMVSGLSADDLVLCVVSGGGSSLLCSPADMSCDEQARLVHLLMQKGANIYELNTVRKHISKVKGGNLAKVCYPATVISLLFSDIPGDDFGMIASGPTVLDSTTVHDAEAVLQKYDALTLCKLPHCMLIETPKEAKFFERVHNILMVSPSVALAAMEAKAVTLGFKPTIWSAAYSGMAEVIASEIVQFRSEKSCLLGAGESVVSVSGDGQGGRNQHLALAALQHISDTQVLVTVASDGVDNGDHAGAVSDMVTRIHSAERGLKPKEFLEACNSYNFFAPSGDYIDTGPTGSNVSDFFVLVTQ